MAARGAGGVVQGCLGQKIKSLALWESNGTRARQQVRVCVCLGPPLYVCRHRGSWRWVQAREGVESEGEDGLRTAQREERI